MDVGVIRVSLNDRFFRIAKEFQLQRVNNRKSNPERRRYLRGRDRIAQTTVGIR